MCSLRGDLSGTDTPGGADLSENAEDKWSRRRAIITADSGSHCQVILSSGAFGLQYALLHVNLNIFAAFQMYNFTSFAMVLNEVDKEMESVIPKTDCRLRPDIRAMENGEIGNECLVVKWCR